MLEQTRAAWEELERLEYALTERILHTPHALPPHYQLAKATSLHGKSKHSQRASMTQQLDMQMLVERYHAVVDGENFEALEKSDADPKLNLVLDLFFKDAAQITDETKADDLSQRYQRFSKSNGTRRFLCPFTETVSPDACFSSLEDYGRCLDLEDLHMRFVNLGTTKCSYLDYLRDLYSLSKASPDQSYIESLYAHLCDFYRRTHPLHLSISEHPAVKEVLQSLRANQLYCTACDKTFASKGVFDGHLNGRKHKRAALDGARSESTLAVIKILIDLLEPQISNTIAEIKRKSGLAPAERELEADAREKNKQLEDMEFSDQDTTKESFTPTQTHQPMGPDGKRMPAWLWKLKGLGTQFRCEICGDAVYMGRKAFEKHFGEQKHMHGLSCLGIEPSPAYNGIVSIKDAKKISKTHTKGPVQDMEEVEDDEGNVMSRKMYDELKRQGLV